MPSATTTRGHANEHPADFSLVLGGPLYQLWRRAHLTGDALQLLRRRIVVLPGLAWVPLLPSLSITPLVLVLPLMLTLISLEELLERLLKMVF